MKIYSKKPLALFLLPFVFLFFFIAKPPTVNAENVSNFQATTTNATCSDYYHFNGVKIDIKPDRMQTVSGSEMTFSGSVLNTNEYPVVSGRLYAKILRTRNVKDSNGPDVLDTFIIKDNITLKSKESLPIEFKWKIPANAIGGEYKLVTYFISADKFNLAGLSFTDDVFGGAIIFNVKGQINTGVSFKRDGVRVDGKPYTFIGYPPIVATNGSVNVTIPILNTTSERQVVNVEFNIYKWDTQSSENKIDTIKQVVVVEPNKSINIPITITDSKYSVYYIEGVLNYKDSKSVVGIRFVRNEVIMPRINFPSIISYPLVSGKKNKIFTCFHNASNSNNPVDGKLVLEILTDDNKTILSYEYNGEIKGEMKAVVQDFTPSSTYKNFKVHASLYEGTRLVDEVYMPYNCNLIDPTKCSIFDIGTLMSGGWLVGALEIIGLFILLAILVFLINRFRKNRSSVSNSGTGKKLTKTFMFFLIFALSLVFHQNVFAAQSSGSGSGSGGGNNSPCFTVTSVDPASVEACHFPPDSSAPDSAKCSSSNTAETVITGTNLSKVGYISIAGYPTKILGVSADGTSMRIQFERLGGEWTQKLNFRSTKFFPKCTAKADFAFVCTLPNINTIWPDHGPTTGGTLVMITGTHLLSTKYLKIANITIKNSDFILWTDNVITFVTPRATEGWKDITVTGVCWNHNWKDFDDRIIKGFQYIKDGKEKVPPIPPLVFPWSTSVGTNETNSITTTNPPLYYWATTSLTDNLDGGDWRSALGENNATILYNSYMTLADGTVLDNATTPTIPIGTKINFHFDDTSTTSSNNINWNGTGYTEDTPIGSWVANAGYPSRSQVCTANNYSGRRLDLWDWGTFTTRNIEFYIPLSVAPPAKTLTFIDSRDNASISSDQSTYPEWGAPPPPNTDFGSWSCDSTDNTSCTPIDAGTKTVSMYYTPTYGYYYYGWKDLDNSNSPCYTNNVPLHSITNMSVNNSALASEIGGNSTCAPGTSACIWVYTNSSGTTTGCSLSYPYYNLDTDKCYDSFTNFLSSYHKDDNVVNTLHGSPTDYYYPYQLRFRESIHKQTFNVIATSTETSRTPGDPVITGPTTITVNVPATYTGVSSLLAYNQKGKLSSMLGSIITAIKKVFAQVDSDPKVIYQFDWYNDGVSFTSTDPVSYGVPASASFTWATAGVITFKVRAKDAVSQNVSNWVPFTVTVAPQASSSTLTKPTLTGTYCKTNLTLSWSNTPGADGYTINRGTSFFDSIESGSINSKGYTNYSTSTNDPFYIYAYSKPVTSTSTVTTVTPPDTWTSVGPNNIGWYGIVSNGDGTRFVAISSPYLYVSTDSGVNWTKKDAVGLRNWTSVASNYSGSKLIAGVSGLNGGLTGGYLYVSSDGGATWSEKTTPGSRAWSSVASDSSGSKLVALATGWGIYTSIDGGSSWTLRGKTLLGWKSVASSADGIKLAAVVQNGYVYTSINSGVTWIKKTSDLARNWSSIASDSYGNNLVAVVYDGYIYRSTDSGNTWSQITFDTTRKWTSITSSADGTKLAAVTYGGYIYTSNDSGSTWSARGSSNDRLSITSSADGNILATTLSYGNIYTSMYSSSTDVVTTTTPGSSSSSSDPLYPANITKAEDCNDTVVPPISGNLTITGGIKFYSNPPWANNTTKQCTLWSSVQKTISAKTEGGATVTFPDVRAKPCYVDTKPVGIGDDHEITPATTPLGLFGIGNHTLSCNITYTGTTTDGTPATASTTFNYLGKCSSLPNVIEK